MPLFAPDWPSRVAARQTAGRQTSWPRAANCRPKTTRRTRRGAGYARRRLRERRARAGGRGAGRSRRPASPARARTGGRGSPCAASRVSLRAPRSPRRDGNLQPGLTGGLRVPRANRSGPTRAVCPRKSQGMMRGSCLIESDRKATISLGDPTVVTTSAPCWSHVRQNDCSTGVDLESRSSSSLRGVRERPNSARAPLPLCTLQSQHS